MKAFPFLRLVVLTLLFAPISLVQADEPVPAGTGPDAIRRQLNQIILPELEFRAALISEVIDHLRNEYARLDPDHRNFSVFLKLPLPDPNPSPSSDQSIPGLPPVPPPAPPLVTLSLKNVPLFEALRYAAWQAGLQVTVEPYAVALVPLTEHHEQLFTAEFHPDLASLLVGAPDHVDARSLLETKGVTFPPGASATYLPAHNKLVVRNTRENIDLIDGLLTNPPGAEGAPTPPDPAVPAPDEPYRKITMAKLKLIVLPNVDFRRAKVTEALDFLGRWAAIVNPDPDPARRHLPGVNLVLQVPGVTPPPPGGPVPDQPHITFQQKNVSLLEALRAVADQAGLRMTVNPDAVILSL